MGRYSDMWVFTDTDGRFGVAYTLRKDGVIRVKPFTFLRKEAADHFVQTIMEEDRKA